MTADIQFGDLAAWVTAIGTLLFFGATWLTIRRDHDARERQVNEERWDQAQLVTVAVAPVRGDPEPDGQPKSLIGVGVTNGGRRQVNDITIWLGTDKVYDLGSVQIGSIPAHRVASLTLPWNDDAFGHSGYRGWLSMEFTDISGIEWRLNPDYTVVKLHPFPQQSRLRTWRNRRIGRKASVF